MDIAHVDTAFLYTRWICAALIAVQGAIMFLRNHPGADREPHVTGATA